MKMGKLNDNSCMNENVSDVLNEMETSVGRLGWIECIQEDMYRTTRLDHQTRPDTYIVHV